MILIADMSTTMAYIMTTGCTFLFKSNRSAVKISPPIPIGMTCTIPVKNAFTIQRSTIQIKSVIANILFLLRMTSL